MVPKVTCDNVIQGHFPDKKTSVRVNYVVALGSQSVYTTIFDQFQRLLGIHKVLTSS